MPKTNAKLNMKYLADGEKYFKKWLEDPEYKELYEEESLKLQIALAVYKRRKEKHFSQAKLAEKAKTTQKVISRIEQGQVSVGIGLLQRIAACLNLKVSISPR